MLEVLTQVGFAPMAERRLSQLSGGQQQRSPWRGLKACYAPTSEEEIDRRLQDYSPVRQSPGGSDLLEARVMLCTAEPALLGDRFHRDARSRSSETVGGIVQLAPESRHPFRCAQVPRQWDRSDSHEIALFA